MSDVYDHISTVVEDMVSLAEDAKDLIDLVRGGGVGWVGGGAGERGGGTQRGAGG